MRRGSTCCSTMTTTQSGSRLVKAVVRVRLPTRQAEQVHRLPTESSNLFHLHRDEAWNRPPLGRTREAMRLHLRQEQASTVHRHTPMIPTRMHRRLIRGNTPDRVVAVGRDHNKATCLRMGHRTGRQVGILLIPCIHITFHRHNTVGTVVTLPISIQHHHMDIRRT